MKIQLYSIVAIFVLGFIAEKCRQLIGEEGEGHSSKSSSVGRERFVFINCFDMRYGTAACLFKEIIKLYLYYIRALYVGNVRAESAEKALQENLSKHHDLDRAVAAAHEEGKAAARRASRQAKHVMGPMVSGGWEFLETIYAGGNVEEGVARCIGTFVGAYGGGIVGEGKIGWLGFVAGSQFGSWIGGRIGLMAYDVGNGVNYLIHHLI